MAGISVGRGHGGQRAMNQELPLIPFIDFLLCLVSFLLITAVWSQVSRLDAGARVWGPPDPSSAPPGTYKQLHVNMRGEEKFQLIWKDGNTVINTIDVPRKQVQVGGDVAYPALAVKIAEEWRREGNHRAAGDLSRDQAVLHTDHTTKFEDVIAVMDAVYAPTREVRLGSSVEVVPAFNLTFAVN